MAVRSSGAHTDGSKIGMPEQGETPIPASDSSCMRDQSGSLAALCERRSALMVLGLPMSFLATSRRASSASLPLKRVIFRLRCEKETHAAALPEGPLVVDAVSCKRVSALTRWKSRASPEVRPVGACGTRARGREVR